MAPSLPQFSAARMRSYVFRLPLFTRAIVFVIIALWIVSMQSVWDVKQWGALIPKEIGLASSMSPFFKAIIFTYCFEDSYCSRGRNCVNMANKTANTVYRTNTFPLVHAGFFHMIMNVIALTPLLERFEAEYGTLTTLALFMGREWSRIYY
jgi:glycosylphosphatidylinositol transamidase